MGKLRSIKGFDYIHPDNPNTKIRIMPFQTLSPKPNFYVRILKEGKYASSQGQIVEGTSTESYTQLSSFNFRSALLEKSAQGPYADVKTPLRHQRFETDYVTLPAVLLENLELMADRDLQYKIWYENNQGYHYFLDLVMEYHTTLNTVITDHFKIPADPGQPNHLQFNELLKMDQELHGFIDKLDADIDFHSQLTHRHLFIIDHPDWKKLSDFSKEVLKALSRC